MRRNGLLWEDIAHNHQRLERRATRGSGVVDNHAQSITESASAKPPRIEPIPSDLTGLHVFISSPSSSPDAQPSEALGVFSFEWCFGVFDWLCADIFARTVWYRRNLASWAGRPEEGAGVEFCDTKANISTRWLHPSQFGYHDWERGWKFNGSPGYRPE